MVRYFGFLANRVVGKLLPLVRKALGQDNVKKAAPVTYTTLSQGLQNTDPLPHSQSKCNKVTHWPDPDKITVLALLEIPLHAGKTSDSQRAVLHRKTAW